MACQTFSGTNRESITTMIDGSGYGGISFKSDWIQGIQHNLDSCNEELSRLSPPLHLFFLVVVSFVVFIFLASFLV